MGKNYHKYSIVTNSYWKHVEEFQQDTIRKWSSNYSTVKKYRPLISVRDPVKPTLDILSPIPRKKTIRSSTIIKKSILEFKKNRTWRPQVCIYTGNRLVCWIQRAYRCCCSDSFSIDFRLVSTDGGGKALLLASDSSRLGFRTGPAVRPPLTAGSQTEKETHSFIRSKINRIFAHSPSYHRNFATEFYSKLLGFSKEKVIALDYVEKV